MVGVGVEVSIGRGVTVGGVESNGRQAAVSNVIARRSSATTTLAPGASTGEQSPNLRGYCFVDLRSPRNDVLLKVL